MQGSHADNLLLEGIRVQDCPEVRFRLPTPEAGKEPETGNVTGTNPLNNVNIGPSFIVSAHTPRRTAPAHHLLPRRPGAPSPSRMAGAGPPVAGRAGRQAVPVRARGRRCGTHRAGAPPAPAGAVSVVPEQVEVLRAREAGPLHVGLAFWERLGCGKRDFARAAGS